MDEERRLRDRVIQLEELLTHQQQLLGQLDEVVISVRRDVESLHLQVEQQRDRLKWLAANTAVIENDPDERPPHY